MKSGKIKKAILGLATLIILFVILFLAREYISNYIVRFNLGSIDIPEAGSRVLVFSPHNDDEVLGPGELISKTLKNGGQVKVVFVTNGDGYKHAIEFDYFDIHPRARDYINFGYTRQKESLNALKTLGLSEKDVTFLGYPDGGVSHLWNSHWSKDDPFTSNYTQTDKSPYYNSYTKGAIYAGESVVSDFTKIIEEFKPTYIVYPHPNDKHPDHWSTNSFVKYVLHTIKYAPKKEYLYLVHRGDWPTPMGKHTNMYLVPPAKLINAGTNWFALDFDPGDINEKTRALSCYKSQMRTLGYLITAFERKNELFGIYPDANIVKAQRNDNEIEPIQENKVLIDPLQDTLRLQISRGADISGIYAELSRENNLHLFIETDGNIEDLTRYSMNMVGFYDNKATRMDVQVTDRRITEGYFSDEVNFSTKDVKLGVKGKYIHFTIPGNYIKNIRHLFLNATSSIDDHLLDKTAWRILDF